MKTHLTTLHYFNGKKTVKKENLQNDDIRLEMLKTAKTNHISWNILDFFYNYECSQTKHGFRVTKTIVQHKKTRETTIQLFEYN